MKLRRSIASAFALLLGSATVAFAQGPLVEGPGDSTSCTATITLGPAALWFPTVGLTAPWTLGDGTHVRLVISPAGLTHPIVTWYKDGKPLTETSTTLDIPSAQPTDSGSYFAVARTDTNPTNVFTSDTARVLVTNRSQRLLNVSFRARLNANQPSIQNGFVVESGPGPKVLLIRAIGPTLANFGVTDALATPQLQVLDSAGNEQTPSAWKPLYGTVYNIGAFPLPPNSKDVANIYMLRPGAYTTVVSSTDGSAGTTLLEIYEIPGGTWGNIFFLFQ